MEVESGNQPPENKRKLKKLYIKIRKQMEFYFSDSNLVKDKFLTDLISKDPDGFVDIEVFKTFNKIKALTQSTKMIATSLSRSSLFELNQDQTRLKRIIPPDLSKNFDACTLYVEKLPQNADQKWIKDVFEHFGVVKYVNIPRYKITNNIKGFAFIEFDDPNGVQKACEFYKAANEKECPISEDESKHPKNAKKKKHDDVHDKKGKRSRGRTACESSEKFNDSSSKSKHPQDSSGKDNGYGSDRHHHKNKRKRKREDSGGEETLKKLKESTTGDVIAVKHQHEIASDNMSITTIKHEHEIAGDIDIVTFKSENEAVTKQPPIKDEAMNTEQEQQKHTDQKSLKNLNNEHNNVMEIEEKTKRKRKKHHSNAEKPLLRVMPKSEWKAFRNKYLDLQRSTMSVLKKQILLQTQEFKELESSTKPIDVPEHKKSAQFHPGVIIKIELNNPVKNTSDIKNEVKANAVVAYVDAPETSSEIFIRCHTPEEAQVIIKEEKLGHLGKTELLKDAEEKRYWEKIENDRQFKFSNPVPYKKRGREKLLAKAAKLEEMKNKHIYFDE